MNLVRTRTQLVNWLHVLLVKLIPTGVARGLSAESAAEALRSVRPRDTLRRTLRALAVDLVAELRRLDRRITEPTTSLSDAVGASGTALTNLLGIGDVVAAKILARGLDQPRTVRRGRLPKRRLSSGRPRRAFRRDAGGAWCSVCGSPVSRCR